MYSKNSGWIEIHKVYDSYVCSWLISCGKLISVVCYNLSADSSEISNV